jgi:hypothetical protein
MPISPLRLIRNSVEYCSRNETSSVPVKTRGIYVLYKYGRRFDSYNVVYVGMAGSENAGVRGRLKSHLRSKGDQWTHFSVYQVWDNIREEEVKELEGLFRHLYRYDHRANKLNKQRGFKKLNQVRSSWFDEWE